MTGAMSSTASPDTTTAFPPTPTDRRQRSTYSTRELQAAAAALAAGQFARTQSTIDAHARSATEPSVTPQPPAGAADADPRGPEAAGAIPMPGVLVRVRAANAGAGASTITLALADAADSAGIRTRVLDSAAPAWSGLIGASVTELGALEGWRCGRRGAGVLIDRVEDHVRLPGFVPVPRQVDGIDLTVLDTGWTARELEASTLHGGGSWVAGQPAHAEVLVTRPNARALGQAEAVLAGIQKIPVVVVVVGAARWSGPEFAAAGPRLRRLHEDQGAVFVPLLPVKALPGLGPDPLPKQLMISAQRLLDLITTITGPLNADPA